MIKNSCTLEVSIGETRLKWAFMNPLTKKEEEIMQVFWSLEKAFVKDIQAALPDPKPHVNTVSTAVRRMEAKGYLGHDKFGSTYRYYPLVSKEAYTRDFLGPKLANAFGNSYKNVVAFFAEEEKITKEDLQDIIDLIEGKENKE